MSCLNVVGGECLSELHMVTFVCILVIIGFVAGLLFSEQLGEIKWENRFKKLR